MEIVSIASSVSLLSGWRLYLCIFATGIAMRFELLCLPEHLASLAVLANPWVIAIAALGALAEFFADKILWLDSLWDAIHSFVRPIGGALLALAIVDPSDPATQVAAFLLGGSASLVAHAGKAGARVAVNASPEPFSNVAVSTLEDAASIGVLALALAYPIAAGVVAAILLALTVWLLWRTHRFITGLFRVRPRAEPPDFADES